MSNKSEATYHGSSEPADMPMLGLPVDYGHESWRPAQTEQEFLGNTAPGRISLFHPNGKAKTADEIREEVADLRLISLDSELHEHKLDHIAEGLRQLVGISGENSRDHGFHDDWPKEYTDGVEVFPSPAQQSAHFKRQIQLAIVEKIALIHEEVSEALGEIRSGHDPLEIYYLDKKTGTTSAAQLYGDLEEDGTRKPMLKPEGFLVELADAVIRIADLVYLVNGREEFIKAQAIKHEYNASREYKHGRKF